MGVKVSLFVLIWTNMCWRQILSTTGSSVTFQFDSINNQFWKAGEEDPDPFDPGEDIKVPTPGNPEHHSRVNFTFEDCDRGIYKGYAVNNDYFPFRNIKNGRMREVVRFLAKSDAHIFLAPVDKDVNTGSYYSIAIGGTFNRRTDIRKHFVDRMEKEVAAISTPNILTTDHYRGFIIDYNTVTGDLALFPELSPYPILRWRDPDPMDIKFYSFSGFASTIVYAAYNCTGTDAHSVISLEEAFAASTLQGFVFGGTPDPRFRKKLLRDYDAMAQPYPYMTTVTIPFLSVIHYDIDDQQQTFEVHAWIVMTWQDDRLRWANQSTYDPSGYLHFAPKEIWTPEITTYNTAKPTVMNDFAEAAQILVQSNGTVLWVPPVRFITNCKMNLLRWPFDEQRCYIKIGSWTFNENELDLQFGPEGSSESRIKVMSYEGHNFPNNTQWVIRESSAVRTAKTYSCCIERYVDITYYFTLGRKSSIITFTLVLPVLLITVVSVTGFLMPIAGTSRITICGINFLVITAYMIYFRMRLPTIDHVPSIGDANTVDGMRTKLLENYDAKMPPPRTDGQPIKVNVGFTLNYFTLDMEEQVFIANAWVRMSWTDSRLAYNATTLTDWVLRFGPDEIWKPDLTLYNNAYPTDIEHYADTHVIVYANGSVLWVPPARVAAHCPLSMTLWPHDKHTCQLKFGSWTHHGQEVDLEFWSYSNETTENGTYSLQPYSYVENSEWTLIETSVDRNAMFYPCCPEPWIDLTFSITFERNSPAYTAIFLTPITFICVVYLLGMMLPPTHGGKLTIGLAQFLILCMFLLYFESKIPALGDHLPLIVVVYLANLGMVTSSLIIAVIVLNLSRTRKAYSPPQCCRFFLSANPSYVKYLCLSHMLPFVPKSDNNPLSYMGPTRGQQPERQQTGPYEAELNGISLEPEVSNTEDSATLVDIDTTVRSPMLNAEWILLACIIDRIAFFTCAVTSFAILLPCYV